MSKLTREEIISQYSSGVITTKKIEKVEKKVLEGVNVKEELKAPIISFMGHVDAGKTSLMDVIKGSSVHENEVGGITQTIGSTFVSIDYIREITKSIKGKLAVEHCIPGFIIIDTPGHSAFTNMRDRGSSLCNVAILVVDVKKGIQAETVESIEMLKEKKVPFIIALNKIDITEGWQESNEINLRKVLKKQSNLTNQLLTSVIEDLKYELSKYNINSEFIFDNKNPQNTYSIVPISTKTKEGLPDLLSLIVYMSQNWIEKKITYRDRLNATIMESSLDKKLGWIIDIILTNGTINVGDKFVVLTNNGPCISTIRNLYILDDNKWIHMDSVRASRGVRIIGSNLDNAISGTRIFRIDNDLSEHDAIDKLQNEFSNYWNSFDWDERGVYLLAPTLGEFDAGYKILKHENIKIKRGDIGKLSMKQINRYISMIENEEHLENRVFMYYHSDVIQESKLEEIQTLCTLHNITLVHNQVIYQLTLEYNKIKAGFVKQRKENSVGIFPVKLKILKDHIYLSGGNDDILIGVRVLEGKLLRNTPIITDDGKYIGIVTNIQKNKTDVPNALKKDEVCIRISNENNLYFQRHFDYKNNLYSRLSRESIDTLKNNFREDMTKEWWGLVIEIKELFNIK